MQFDRSADRPASEETQLDHITLTGIEVDCFIGIFPHERQNKQPLELDLTLSLHTQAAARSGSLRDSIDYGLLHNELHFLLEACQFSLLETAADALCHYVLAPAISDRRQAYIETVALTLRKPRALPGRAVAGLRVVRHCKDTHLERQTTDYGCMEMLYHSRDCRITRHVLAAGKTLQGVVPANLHYTDLILSKGFSGEERAIALGAHYSWQSGQSFKFHNGSLKERTLLRVDRQNTV